MAARVHGPRRPLHRLRRRPRCSAAAAPHCGIVLFPRVDACTYCATEDPEPVELSRQGTLWSWTAVTAPPPGYEGEVPFGVGIVELPEGVRVITRLTESDPAALHLGQAMELRVVPLHTDADGQRRRHLRLRPDGPAVSGSPPVVVTGVGMHPFGRFDGVSTTDMGVVAVRCRPA